MAAVEVKLWSVKRAAFYGIAAGAIWHSISTPSSPDYTYDPFADFVINMIKGSILFAVVAWGRNKLEQLAAVSLSAQKPAPILAVHDEGEKEEADDDFVEPLTPEEEEVRKAATLVKQGQQERLDAYRTQQDGLREAKDLADRADKFATNSHLAYAVPYMFDEMQHWPSWSKRDDAGKWVPSLGLTDLNGEGEYRNKWLEWRCGGHLFRITFQMRERYFHDSSDTNDYADFSVSVDSQEVFKFMAKRNAISEFDRWSYTIIDSLQVGPWVSQLIELYNAVRAYHEQKMADMDAEYHLNRAARITLRDTPAT